MFKTRLLSGILLVIIALATIISGGKILFATLLIISLIGMSELYKVFQIHNKALGICGYIFAVVYYVYLYEMIAYEAGTMGTGLLGGAMETISGVGVAIIFMALVIAMMAIYVFTFPKFQVEQVMAAFFGVFYVAVMLSYIFQTRALADHGNFSVWLVFLCSWGCDTCAYCVGVLFGKHKMAPVLSPKKSIEGAVGGVAGAALLGALYALAINHWGGASASIPVYAGICAVGGLISMVGDLAASAIKRNHAVKDYGKLIPGHGGILDRFDSVIFVAPIIYYLLVLVY
ncbi:phosphatidate cytidylyltransferase [Hespellia stercorisuis]|uniref:Phosphatidate cytidylyltransferase n=1 Tax=Hespellia stercorisuis DSM 15480 TaxID=1121950 RepID=A0A1M6HUJ5_9FIRM|nr:phosphatidate cytidylyltransferase [Hespellia stercorisuis]SHJ25853.1 phosphatidate cytidylyltransferase [Hespellia stercorisuis DSM 15480]